MNIYACGLNHKTAPLSIREHIVQLLQQLTTPLQTLHAHPAITEIALLNTCNRTEIYCVTTQKMDIIPWLLTLIQQSITAPIPDKFQSEYKNYLYSYNNEVAIEHMLRVASGLESLVLGESQIMGQLKHAVAQARMLGTLGRTLGKLFDFIFHVSKHIRTETGLNRKPISIASVSLNVAKQIFADFHPLKGVFIGASSINQLAMRHFYEHGMRDMYLVNRTLHKQAKEIAARVQATLVPLADMPQHIFDADIVVSATSAPHYLIEPSTLQQRNTKKLGSKLLLLDLAVPRDIHPGTEQCKNVFLYTIDNLQHVIGQHLAERSSAASVATEMIKHYTDRYIQKIDERRIDPILIGWRQQHQQIALKELAFITKKLSAGMDSHTALQQLAYRLTQKFLHQPTLILKKISTTEASDHPALLEEFFYPQKSDKEQL